MVETGLAVVDVEVLVAGGGVDPPQPPTAVASRRADDRRQAGRPATQRSYHALTL